MDPHPLASRRRCRDRLSANEAVVTGRLYAVRATCARCGDAIRLLGRDWHHAVPRQHEPVPEFFGPIYVEHDVIMIADLDEMHRRIYGSQENA